MWLMAGLAVVIILVVLVAGRSQPPGPASSTMRRASPHALPDADRIRAYQQQLAEDESRLRQVQKEAMTPTAPPSDGGGSPSATGRRRGSGATDEARRRDYQSLFADNVAFSRRTTQQPADSSGACDHTADRCLAARRATAGAGARRVGIAVGRPLLSCRPPQRPTSGRPARPAGSALRRPRDENPAPGSRLPLLEGTVSRPCC